MPNVNSSRKSIRSFNIDAQNAISAITSKQGKGLPQASASSSSSSGTASEHGIIDCSPPICRRADSETKKPYSMKILTPKRIFYMFSDSNADIENWISNINFASTMYIPSPGSRKKTIKPNLTPISSSIQNHGQQSQASASRDSATFSPALEEYAARQAIMMRKINRNFQLDNSKTQDSNIMGDKMSDVLRIISITGSTVGEEEIESRLLKNLFIHTKFVVLFFFCLLSY